MKNHVLFEIFFKYLTLLTLSFSVINCSSDRPENFQSSQKIRVSENAVNINTATAEELEKLPNVGAKTAAKIIEHREKFGGFRRPEHLLLVAGISDKRFRDMRRMIKTK